MVRDRARPLLQDPRAVAWLVMYLVVLIAASYPGSSDFGGAGHVRAPWDSIAVAAPAAVG